MAGLGSAKPAWPFPATPGVCFAVEGRLIDHRGLSPARFLFSCRKNGVSRCTRDERPFNAGAGRDAQVSAAHASRGVLCAGLAQTGRGVLAGSDVAVGPVQGLGEEADGVSGVQHDVALRACVSLVVRVFLDLDAVRGGAVGAEWMPGSISASMSLKAAASTVAVMELQESPPAIYATCGNSLTAELRQGPGKGGLARPREIRAGRRPEQMKTAATALLHREPGAQDQAGPLLRLTPVIRSRVVHFQRQVRNR